MSRSLWKGPFSQPLYKALAHPMAVKQIWSRTSMILPEYVDKNFKVHNGKGWVSLKIIEEMVGHKFGEFSSTRRKTVHKFQKRKQTSTRNSVK